MFLSKVKGIVILGRFLGSLSHISRRGVRGHRRSLGPADVPPKLQWFSGGHHLQGRKGDVFLGAQCDDETGLLEFVEDGERGARGCGEDQRAILDDWPDPGVVEPKFCLGVGAPGAVGDGAKDGESAFG